MAKKVDPIPRIKKVVEKRRTEQSKWLVDYTQYGIAEVYSSLCEDLLRSRKKDKAVSLIRVYEKDDGSRKVSVYYGPNYRATYHIDGF